METKFMSLEICHLLFIFVGVENALRYEKAVVLNILPSRCNDNNKFIQYYHFYTWCYRLKYNKQL